MAMATANPVRRPAPAPGPLQPPPAPAEPGAAVTLKLRSAEFRKGREKGWRRLEEMVGRIEAKGITALSAEEIEELPLLYRAAVSSLSVARGIVLDRHLLLYLENLALRAYLAVYGPRVGLWSCLRDFLRRGFPRAVRGLRWHLLAALAALAAGTAAGYLLVHGDLSWFDFLVPESLAQGRGPESSAEELGKDIFSPWPGFVDTFIVFANSLFRHNAVVGLLAFGLGFGLGLPTLFLLIHNGLILGAFVSLHAQKGLGLDFVGWLSIHGVTELLAVLLCGAAGLMVAEKIIFPGARPRLDSLAHYGRAAAGVAAGAVGLFFIAGFLEGGCRQLIANTPGRFAMALLTGGLWLMYFRCVGREADDDRPD